jgi:hypothetical protein
MELVPALKGEFRHPLKGQEKGKDGFCYFKNFLPIAMLSLEDLTFPGFCFTDHESQREGQTIRKGGTQSPCLKLIFGYGRGAAEGYDYPSIFFFVCPSKYLPVYVFIKKSGDLFGAPPRSSEFSPFNHPFRATYVGLSLHPSAKKHMEFFMTFFPNMLCADGQTVM